nr:Pycsar system effector family protein [Ornithinimicrobium cryptoxanthini]
MVVLSGCAGLVLVAASLCASAGLLPRYKHQTAVGQVNPLYYSDIAHHYAGKEDDYLAHLRATMADPPTLVRQIGRQALANSGVAQQKYLWANRAILLGVIALMLIMVVAVGLVRDW